MKTGTRKQLTRKYFTMFLAGFALFAMVSGIGFVYFRAWPAGCDGTGYSKDHYMAWCSSPNYQFYEHGALFTPLDPQSIPPLKAAKVLFLGTSRTQTAFSTKALSEYFTRTNTKHYLLGFGGNEMDILPRKIIEKYDLRPDFVVIDAVGFFENSITSISTSLVRGSAMAQLEYGAKSKLQGIHQSICAGEDGIFKDYFCGKNPTLYRSRSNGHWKVLNQNVTNEIPLTINNVIPEKEKTRLPFLIYNARAFQKKLKKRGACMVITSVPTTNVSPKIAEKIAQAIGAPFINPKVDGLATWDRSHLNVQSAEKFSQAFATELAKISKSCL